MKIVGKYLKKAALEFPSYFLKAVYITILCSLLHSSIPWVLRAILNNYQSNKSLVFLVASVGVLVCLLFINVLLQIRWILSLDRFGGKYIEKLLCECERKIVSTDSYIIDEIGIEFISHTLYSNVLDVFRVVGHHFPQIIGSLLIVVLSLLISSRFNIIVSFFLFVSFFFGVLVSYLSRKTIISLTSETNAKLKSLHALIEEFSSIVPFIKINLLDEYYTNKTSIYTQSFIQSSISEDKKVYFFSGLIKYINVFFQIIFSIIISVLISNNSLINVVVYTMVFDIVMEQGGMVEQVLLQINRSVICFKNIDKLLSLSAQSTGLTIGPVKAIDINIKRFSYACGNNPALSNVVFSAKSGDCILLNGRNGSGKTSFLRILSKDYETFDGEILINGINLNKINKKYFYDVILYLRQDEPLLNETIEEYFNTICNNASITDKKINEIFKLLNIGILPERISDNGNNLSEGQRKKLLITKLLLNKDKAQIILLDEVDSGLDVQTKQIYEQIINDMVSKKEKIIFITQHTKESNIKYTKKIVFE